MRTPVKTRRSIKADTSAYERGDNLGQDPQVHGQDADVANEPTGHPDPVNNEVMVTKNSVSVEPAKDDAILSEPLKYVVSAPEAAERVEVLLEKIREARPDLAGRVGDLLDGLKGLTDGPQGEAEAAPAVAATPEPQPTPDQAQPGVQPQGDAGPAETAFNPGDRVTATTKDGEFAGVIEDVNEDGTFEVLTDKNMKLSHVPADAVVKEEGDAAGSMALPAGIQSSRRRDVRKQLKANPAVELDKAAAELGQAQGLARRARSKPGKPAETLIDMSDAAATDAKSHLAEAKEAVKASPEKGMGAGVEAGAGQPAPAAHDPKAEMAVRAAKSQFMSGTLNLDLMAAYHPAAQAEVKRLLADKTVKFAASAFDKLDTLDLGGGYTAKRGESKDDEKVKTVVVADKEGKAVATYPDAFGDDTVTIIKLLRQLHDITPAEDEKAAKTESKADMGESKKPKAMPKVEEKKEKSDDDKELEAAQRVFEQRLEVVRTIVADRVSKRYVVAQQDVIDAHLLKGMGLEASMNEALRAAVDGEVLRLLSLPDTELLSIRASLGGLKARPVEVETKVSSEGLTMMGGLQVYAEEAPTDGLDISGAFGSSFRRG